MNPGPGLVREVSAYNVVVRELTSDDPHIGATGRNFCRLVARGLKVCAANFVDPETILHIEGYGECIVLDRMNRRFALDVSILIKYAFEQERRFWDGEGNQGERGN